MEPNKKSNLKNVTYIIILFIVILLLFTGYSIGKSFNQIAIKSKAQIAEPIIEVISNPKVDITNSESEGTYTFYVRNYNKEQKVSETKIQYIISIEDSIEEQLKDTITYELYQNGQKIELQNQKTEKMQLSNESRQQKEYQLKIKYNKEASSYMQDILEKIQIKVHSEQQSSS